MKGKKKNGLWERVNGPNLHPEHREIHLKNKDIFKSKVFVDACEAVGIPPTLRQASKFRKKCGKAYTKRS